jgi:hypothetical protein
MTVRVTVKDHGAKRARELLKRPRLSLRVGVLQEQGTQLHPSGATIAQIAWWMEKGFFAGDRWIWPRSWLFDWLDENEKQIAKKLTAATMRVIYGQPPESEREALGKLGTVFRRGIWYRIRDVPAYWAPLEDSTVRKKGHAAPLIETTTFINAIRWEVV